MQQGSAIWKQQRSERIGGSEVAAILGISPYMTAYQLWEIKTGKKIQEDISNLPHVQRGVMGEKVCRMRLEAELLKNFTPKTWRIEGTHYGASDDGYNEELSCFLEIKCMGKENHANVEKGIIPAHYMCQVQYNLFVSGCKEAWFISYRPEDDSLLKIVVKPDAKYQKEIKKAVDIFWLEHVKKDVAPELSDKDFVVIKDDKFQALALEYRQLYAAKKATDVRLEEIKEALKDFAKDHSAIRGNGVRIRKYYKQGPIDYARVPALSGIDLSSFRRPGSLVVDLRLEADPAS